MISYDYEPIYALAILLGGTDPRGFLQLMDKVEAAGIDAISTGVVLAWATEAFERGLISTKETDGLRLAWGDFPTYIQALEGILQGTNEFYRTLRLGVGEAARRYGGQEFALAFAGHEMAGYHTGPAAHIGFLIGARHSHLDNAGYALDQKMTPEQLPSPEEMVQSLLAEESWRQVLSSLVVCFFARGIYTPELVSRALEMSGHQLSAEDLQRLGREIWRAKYDFKLREGFSFDNLPIPRRILETPTALGNLSEETFRRAVATIKGELGQR
jgi:aldehyde:ferredoxin oxidoreductase